MKEITIEGTIYRVGQNAVDNTELIKKSDLEWYWVHLTKFPSAHVVILTKLPSSIEIQHAINLVWENSKYKFDNIGMCYCKINNLILGENPGDVSFVSKRQVQHIKYIKLKYNKKLKM